MDIQLCQIRKRRVYHWTFRNHRMHTPRNTHAAIPGNMLVIIPGNILGIFPEIKGDRVGGRESASAVDAAMITRAYPLPESHIECDDGTLAP